jgi:hypothetical protein
MDPRPAAIKLVDQDIRRALRFLPKDGQTRYAWVRVAVSSELWELFYPPLSFIVPEDPIHIVAFWDTEKKELHSWCVTEWGRENEAARQRTALSLEPFGVALAPAEVDEFLDITAPSQEAK